jgi:hypothetical protein
MNEYICWICSRRFYSKQGRFLVGPPTQHHVVPREFRKRRRFKNEKTLLCNACHRQINKMFSNKELLNMSKDEVRHHPKVVSWVKWIRKE